MFSEKLDGVLERLYYLCTLLHTEIKKEVVTSGSYKRKYMKNANFFPRNETFIAKSICYLQKSQNVSKIVRTVFKNDTVQ